MKNIRIFALLLAVVMVVALFAGCSGKEETTEPVVEEAPVTEVAEQEAAPAPEAPANDDASGEPAAPPADNAAVPTAEGKYSIGLIRDDTAKAELNISSGSVVDIALDYAGKDSTVSFDIESVSDESVCTAVADVLTITISGAKAGTSVVTATWTAVNTSGSTYVVEITVNVNDEGVESFTELTVGDSQNGGASGEPAQGGASDAPTPIGEASGDPAAAMEPGGILFCGSSLMGGFRIVDTFLEEDGYDISTGNISMGGTTIADFAAAQKENIVAMQPGAIFINIGSVDVDRVASEVFDMQFMQDSYRDLLTYLRDNLPDCGIYVMAYYPSQENTFRPNALVDECNVWVEELANELGLHFVNVSGVLKNEKGYLREDFSADGIHLTDEAYRLVYEELKPYLLEAAGLA